MIVLTTLTTIKYFLLSILPIYLLFSTFFFFFKKHTTFLNCCFVVCQIKSSCEWDDAVLERNAGRG